MTWWAVGLYSIALRLAAIVFAFFALAGFFVSLLVIREIQLAFARAGVVFVQGTMGVLAVNLCGLGIALFVALAIFASGQILMLLISLELNVRGLRADLRTRRRSSAESELPGPQQAPPRIVDDMRNAAPARYRQQVDDLYGPPLASAAPRPDGPIDEIDGVLHPPGTPRPSAIRPSPRVLRDNDRR